MAPEKYPSPQKRKETSTHCKLFPPGHTVSGEVKSDAHALRLDCFVSLLLHGIDANNNNAALSWNEAFCGVVDRERSPPPSPFPLRPVLILVLQLEELDVLRGPYKRMMMSESAQHIVIAL